MINYIELVKNNPQYFKQFSCKGVLFLNYDCPTEVKKAAKWSEYNYVYFVLTGRKTLHTIEKSYDLRPGKIAFVKKGACITEQFFDETFCIVVFILPDSFILEFVKDYAPGEKPHEPSTQPIIMVEENELIYNFYQTILPYFETTTGIPEDIVELKFKELLLHILHNPANTELKDYFLTLRDQKTSPIKEIMETNYPYNLGIEAYARLTNRSVSSFKRDFQSIFKTTPGRWLIEKKINHAKKLLLERDDSIASVAFDSGFESTAHFSRVFKQKTGITPMEFRKHALESRGVTA
jgi:AraC family transcriptional regulator, exoenzyme S synthesis regulatory protein ExsA